MGLSDGQVTYANTKVYGRNGALSMYREKGLQQYGMSFSTIISTLLHAI